LRDSHGYEGERFLSIINMKVLIISNMFPTNKDENSGIFIKHQIESLKKTRIEILEVMKLRLSNFGYLNFYLKTFFYLFFREYDLVHAHYGFHSALLPGIIKKKPLVVTFHGSDALKEPLRNKIYFYLQKFIISRSDHIIAVSKEIKDILILKLNANPEKISVISCGVNTINFIPLKKEHIRRKFNIQLNKKIILFVGNLGYEKGIDIVYKCAIIMSNVLFILIGKGSKKAAPSNCKLLGIIPNKEINIWMNISDILFLPSRSEGTPLVVLEAMSCGIPVVASKVGGIPDLIKDGETGYLVESGNLKLYIRKLQDLLRNPKKCRQMGIEGRKIVVNNYDNLIIAKKISKIYTKFIELDKRKRNYKYSSIS